MKRTQKKQLTILVGLEFHPGLQDDLGAIVKDALEQDGELKVLSVQSDEQNMTRDLTMDLPILRSHGGRRSSVPPAPKRRKPPPAPTD